MPQDLRQLPRIVVRLPCALQCPGSSVAAMTLDLSPAGARVALPLLGLPEFWLVEALSIPALGWFAVEPRWQSGLQIGLRFSDTDRASDLIGQFLGSAFARQLAAAARPGA